MTLCARAARTGLAGVMALTLASAGCSSSVTGGDGDDGNTPYVIFDLRVTGVTANSVTLAWTATGDDADVGAATAYDLRIWDEPITPDIWGEATQCDGEPAPGHAGLRSSTETS